MGELVLWWTSGTESADCLHSHSWCYVTEGGGAGPPSGTEPADCLHSHSWCYVTEGGGAGPLVDFWY